MLVNNKTGKKLFITQNQRVIVFWTGEISEHVGVLQKITDDNLVVDGIVVKTLDITSIGRRRKGSGFQRFIYSFFAGGFIVQAIESARDTNDPCPTCQTVSSTGTGAAVVEALVASAAFIALDVNVIIRNTAHDVDPNFHRKWEMRIVD